jgi:hypothetical protein
MAIPASHIVKINPRVMPPGSEDFQTNGLLLSLSGRLPRGAVIPFSSARAVREYFGAGSPEEVAAEVYFNAYDSKFLTPRAWHVTRAELEASGAWIRGARFGGGLADLKAVTAGTLTLEIGGASVSASGIDLSGAVSHSDAATLIGTALAAQSPGTAAEYDSLSGSFTIRAPGTGEASTIGRAADSPLAELLGLTERSGATLSRGGPALSVAELFDSVREVTENGVTFTTAWEVSDAELEAYAAWASANYGFIYTAWTADRSCLNPTVSADPASLLKDGGYDNTSVVFGTLRHASFVQGIAAAVPWERANGTVTFAFKSQAGLEATVTREADADALEAKNCSYYGNFATRNAEFRLNYPGVLSASDYGYLDPLLNSIWLNSRLQRALCDGLMSSQRVPYNERGYGMIRAWIAGVAGDALNNGTIERGVTLSATQKSELESEANRDISNELFSYGYVLQVLDPGNAARNERRSPIINFWYCYGGAVHRLEMASTAIL